MINKLDLLLAICKANCDKCGNEDWLFIPTSNDYGLLCENCMTNLSIDMTETKNNLGELIPD